MGGLGVGDVIIRNAAMLFKWWWRFVSEDNSLWKQVVCSCHNLRPQMPISDIVLQHKGGVWGGICDVWKINNNVENICMNGIRKVVGNGSNTSF